MSDNGRIVLTADDGSEEAFFVLEKAEIAGATYLLVASSLEDEDAEALILREKIQSGQQENGQGDGEIATYEVVGDENELKIISKYMEELLEDIDIKLE